MKTKRYNHTLVRMEYPMENGFRIESKILPDWIYFTITTDGDSKYLTVYSRIHLNKEVRIMPVYGIDFSDEEMIKDLSCKIYNMFLD